VGNRLSLAQHRVEKHLVLAQGNVHGAATSRSVV
jgi:hypothetical protein